MSNIWKCDKCGREFKNKVPGHGTYTDGVQTAKHSCNGILYIIAN